MTALRKYKRNCDSQETCYQISHVTCEKGLSNFSTNLRVVTLKLFELTQFASPNYQYTFISYVPLGDISKRVCFLMSSTVNRYTLVDPIRGFTEVNLRNPSLLHTLQRTLHSMRHTKGHHRYTDLSYKKTGWLEAYQCVSKSFKTN